MKKLNEVSLQDNLFLIDNSGEVWPAIIKSISEDRIKVTVDGFSSRISVRLHDEVLRNAGCMSIDTDAIRFIIASTDRVMALDKANSMIEDMIDKLTNTHRENRKLIYSLHKELR